MCKNTIEMKKNFITPSVRVVRFDSMDILVGSASMSVHSDLRADENLAPTRGIFEPNNTAF